MLTIYKNQDFELFPDATEIFVESDCEINDGDVVLIEVAGHRECRFACREKCGFRFEHPSRKPRYSAKIIGRVMMYAVEL